MEREVLWNIVLLGNDSRKVTHYEDVSTLGLDT